MLLSKLLRQLSMELRATEEGQRQLLQYREMQKSPGWKVYQTLVVTVANGMTQYMLSKEYTEQDAATKDREQWAMFMAKDVFDFLLDPMEKSKGMAEIQLHNQQMEDSMKRPTAGAKSVRPSRKG